jgi:hypothetical protein
VYEVSNSLASYLYGGGYIDYTYSFNVSAVPLPGALGLFGAGVSSLAVFFRRRRGAEG